MRMVGSRGLDWKAPLMSSLLSRFTDKTRNVFKRHRTREFMEGAMAASALVALADGDASLEEGAEVERLMTVFSVLKDHQPQDGVDAYLKYVDIIRHAEDGVDRARRAAVNAAQADEEAAALLVLICQAISEADGVVKESELVEIRALARLLAVQPENTTSGILD